MHTYAPSRAFTHEAGSRIMPKHTLVFRMDLVGEFYGISILDSCLQRHNLLVDRDHELAAVHQLNHLA